MFTDANPAEIRDLMKKSFEAFFSYRSTSLHLRAELLRTIAREIEALGDALLQTAMKETHLPEARLRNERARTIFQLTSYAEACEKGDWLEIRIDTGDPHRNPPKPDLRKMLVPLGPVVVFGAANFPFAYSTAGGDTASALAAGCSVVVKAHPAHAETSEMVAGAIHKAIKKLNLAPGIFEHIHGASFEAGRALVEDPHTAAVGFTGSFAGGKALYDAACRRPKPIPVFAEMSSTNPVFLLPGRMREAAEDTAKMLAGSITLGVGQFCTNPGLMVAIDNADTHRFIDVLTEAIRSTAPAPMLHEGICNNYRSKRASVLAQPGVELKAIAAEAGPGEGNAAIAITSASQFTANPEMHKEVFGPFSLLILCKDIYEMHAVCGAMEGQLTATVMASGDDINTYIGLLDKISYLCGRFILNNVPTGVEVCLSMQHGGPFPATTDSRFTAVGADAIKRFVRPLAFQNWLNEWLPAELKDENPLGLLRIVDGEWSRDPMM